MRSSAAPIFLFGLFGVSPFIVWAALAMTNTSFMGYSGIQLFATYGAIILSFFNGVIFGQVLERPKNAYSRRVILLNHLIAVIAWVTILFSVPILSVAILLLGFISTFWLEIRFLKLLFSNNSSHSKVRFSLITVICILHIIVLFPQY